LRRKGRVFETIEKFSVIKTLQAVEEANVVVLMVDASQEISDQDAHIAGSPSMRAVPWWSPSISGDAVDEYRRERVKQDIARKLNFLGFAKVHTISALKGQGIAGVLNSVDRAYAAAMAKLSTPKLTRVLIAAVEKQTPPRHGAFRPKLRYAHQGGSNPPVVVIHGTALEHVPASYTRYLERYFLEAFKLQGTPMRIQYKTARNPYVD
jgi:GTP-binding protein